MWVCVSPMRFVAAELVGSWVCLVRAASAASAACATAGTPAVASHLASSSPDPPTGAATCTLPVPLLLLLLLLQAVVQAGAVHQMRQLLDSPHEAVREQVMWGLGNIAGEKSEFRDYILNCEGAVQSYVKACRCSEVSTVRTGVWGLSNLCRGKPRPPLRQIVDSVEYLCEVLHHSTDPATLSDACWALDGVGETEGGVQALVGAGAVPRLVQLMGHQETKVQRPSLRVVGQVATGTTTETQHVLDAGVMHHLVKLIYSPRKSIRKDSCWTLSNIAAGDSRQLEVLISTGALCQLVSKFSSDEDAEVRKEAAWAICNACTTRKTEQLAYMLSIECVKPMCEMLDIDDIKVWDVVLDALHNALRYGRQEAARRGMHSARENPCVGLITSGGGEHRLREIINAFQVDRTVWQKSRLLLNEYFGGDGLNPDHQRGHF
eukprot:GHVU01112719.1.p1 GENE.GHVU01112719.1~~GHVU01112719.1.p1  ORF type:complete len:434 (-),score=50.89 GHVU01112719.1:153-1454(-)